MFGEEIREKCTVRMELAKESSVDINKWVKPQDPTYDGVGQLLEQMGAINNALVTFCDMCPHLTLYMERNSMIAQAKLKIKK